MSNVNQSKLLAKLKAKSKGAWKRAKNTEAKARGQGGFPPNLKNIVAVCQSYKMAETKKGDPYFALTAIVKDPEEFVGRRATFMWFINESEYATVEDNLENLANDLKLLGCDMPDDEAELPNVLASLCEAGVHLLFNTGGPRKNGGSPNLFIQGLAEDWPDEPYEDGSSDNDEASDDSSDDSSTENESEPEAEPEAESDDPWIPVKGEKYFYTPPKAKTAITVTVTAVDKKKETFSLKGGKPPKEYKNIPWFDKDGNPTVEAIEE